MPYALLIYIFKLTKVNSVNKNVHKLSMTSAEYKQIEKSISSENLYLNENCIISTNL